ncbi:hypothetical protein E3E35_05730 [Thermococcus sp. GR7]|uniref:hypothetical protein n=1 Tax=unclassified Thermococcus TaxID=2627626 RepID=UPI00142F9E54|nr:MULTISPECIES: hypothetical protein [unclassified Thermococcus]NJE46916.1 hypothetical protein [Thermococcus sp. GR7]NJE78413.1 hypothetical protein [Thermococcus sp. GR4]NJF23290.1 hypothetical protein [Thermococcus sp. GR5]
MFEVVRILYRELHYRRLKSNPQIASDPKKFEKQLKTSGDIIQGILFQSIVFLFFGFIMAMAIKSTGDKTKAVIMFSTYAMLPFVMALYTTAVNASYTTSMGIFEPLKPLPIKTGARYLSLLLMIDNVPALVAMLPSVGVLALNYGLTGILGLLWITIGAFLGHVLGLMIFTFFGSASVGGRFSSLKTLARTIGVLLFISMFYALNYIQAYVSEHYEELIPVFSRYSIAYPFSVTSILEPIISVLILLGYIAILAPLYLVVIRRLWERMGENLKTSRTVVSKFRAKILSPVLALTMKDLRIIFRKSSLLVGLLLPLFIVLPSALNLLMAGSISEWAVVSVLFMIAWMASVGIDTVLKIDGLEFEFLRSLPITLGQFVKGKLITMNAVPISAGVVLVLVASYLNPYLLKLVPAAIVLPLLTSSLAMTFFYHGEKELSLPETNFGHVIALMILNGITLGIVAGVWFLLGYPYAMGLSILGIFVFLKAVSR